MDCWFETRAGVTVLDFKSDRVTEETLPERVRQYRPQVLAYAGALERIYGKPVKEALLYFFHTGQIVEIK